MNLKVDEVKLHQKDEIASGLLFAGDFDYSLVNMEKETKLDCLYRAIDKWQEDVSLFQVKIAENIIKTAQASISEQPEGIEQPEAEKVLH